MEHARNPQVPSATNASLPDGDEPLLLDDDDALLAPVGEVVVARAHVVVGALLELEHHALVRGRGVVELVLERVTSAVVRPEFLVDGVTAAR